MEGLSHLFLCFESLLAYRLPVVDELLGRFVQLVVIGKDLGVQFEGLAPLLEDRAILRGKALEDRNSFSRHSPSKSSKETSNSSSEECTKSRDNATESSTCCGSSEGSLGNVLP